MMENGKPRKRRHRRVLESATGHTATDSIVDNEAAANPCGTGLDREWHPLIEDALAFWRDGPPLSSYRPRPRRHRRDALSHRCRGRRRQPTSAQVTAPTVGSWRSFRRHCGRAAEDGRMTKAIAAQQRQLRDRAGDGGGLGPRAELDVGGLAHRLRGDAQSIGPRRAPRAPHP